MTNLFEWQRAMRSASLPSSLKLLLWTVASYSGMDGRDARPSAVRLASDMSLSRQRVFELLRDAQESGWITRVGRPGKATEYVLSMPYPSDPSDGLGGDESDSDGGQPSADADDPSDPPDGSTALTRQTHLTGKGSHSAPEIPYPSDPSDTTRQTHLTRPTQDQPTTGGTLPPDPLRPMTPQAPSSTDQPLPDQADGPDANSSPKPDPPPALGNGQPVALVAVISKAFDP